MAIINTTLTKQEQNDLRHYAEVLKQYICPDIRSFFYSIRKLPKVKRLESKRIFQERRSLQDKLNISWRWGCGLWILDMIGPNDTPGSQNLDKGYWWIFPLKSYKEDYLNFLAKDALPRVFRGEAFYVNSTMIPCNQDCSWDIKYDIIEYKYF